MAIAPLTVLDSFSRTLSSSLGTSDSGHAWTTNAPVNVGSGRANFVSSANLSRRYARVDVGNTQAAASVLTKIRFTSNATWPLTDFGPTLLHSSSNSAYGLTLQSNYSEIAIVVFINGYRYEMNRRSFSLLKNVSYWIRLQVTTSGVRAKVWEEGKNEPSSWTITSLLWDGSSPPQAGHAGFFVQGTRDTYTAQVESFYYYTDDERGRSTLAEDTFNDRFVHAGFGYADSGHAWEGAFSDDPVLIHQNNIGGINNNFASLNIQNTDGHYGFLGKDVSGDIEAYAQMGFVNNYSGIGVFRLGLRGTMNIFGGKAEATGYAAQLNTGSNFIRIVKRTSPTTGWTTLASGTPHVLIDASSTWRVRVQIIGNTIRARYWKTNDPEPTEWQVSVNDSGISSGKLWCGFSQSQAVSRNFNFYETWYQAPTQDADVVYNFTQTGSVSSSSTTDTSINVVSFFEHDANENASATLRYKPTSATSWINFGSMTRGDLLGLPVFFAEVTGLQPSTTYNAEVTIQDPDGVQGSNPIYTTIETAARGVVAQDLEVTHVDSTSISIQAAYTADTDNDSTANIQARKTSTKTAFVEDYFVDEREGTYLQNTQSVRGGQWEKHPTATPEVDAIRSGRYFYVNTKSANDTAFYMHSEISPITAYEAEATFLGTELNGKTGIAFRINDTEETYIGFGINADTRKWEYFTMVDGVKTILRTKDFTENLDHVHTLRIESNELFRRFSLNGEAIFSDFHNALPETGRVGYYSTDIIDGSSSNQFRLNSFVAHYRTSLGSFVDYGAMDVNRANKTFTKTITNLDADSVYEVRVTFNDEDASESDVLAITAMTTGSAVKLSAMGATTYPTSSIIDVFYEYDINNNSYISIQYKSTREYLWTTVAIDKVRSDRVIKKHSITLAGLRPSTTYEVRATVVDPDGLIEGSPETLVGLFTTAGLTIEEQKEHKHYAWKVYDPDGKYLATLPDAPTPNYSIYENGGVTDLSFTLYRKMSEYETQRIINYQNIIDVWAIDPSSDGMGVNMIADPDCDPDVGGWVLDGETYGQNAQYFEGAGPDGSSCLEIRATEDEYETSSNPIEVEEGLPLVIRCIARAWGAKLRMYARAYDVNDVALDSSEIAETVGTDWQNLRVEYIPPKGTTYIRVLIRNAGRGFMVADKFSVLSKEVLVYRGRIEAFTPKVTLDGESIDVEVLGLASLLSDDYIEFLQFVEIQPQKDVLAGRINHGAKDPADIFKAIIDQARRSNPFFGLYYTSESIRYTGQLMQYTFRDQQVRACFDKTRTLCPSGWHYYIEPDGLVVLRGPDSAPTHILRIGVEITEFEVERSIRNLKNYVRVKGRQDEDQSEADGFGSINYIAFDQASIDKYGKRVVFVRDAQLTDPESAKIVGDGRLDEYNREEQRVQCVVPDEKSEMARTGSLKGYNVESLRAGDNVIIVDPIAGPRNTYWDQFHWDEESWDISNVYMPLPEPVPIKTIQFQGSVVALELSERPPSAVGDFSKFERWMANKDRED